MLSASRLLSGTKSASGKAWFAEDGGILVIESFDQNCEHVPLWLVGGILPAKDPAVSFSHQLGKRCDIHLLSGVVPVPASRLGFNLIVIVANVAGAVFDVPNAGPLPGHSGRLPGTFSSAAPAQGDSFQQNENAGEKALA